MCIDNSNSGYRPEPSNRSFVELNEDAPAYADRRLNVKTHDSTVRQSQKPYLKYGFCKRHHRTIAKKPLAIKTAGD